MFVNVGKTKICESKQQKHLGVLIDRDFKFDEYVLSQCKKAGNKLTALIRISKFMTFAQRRNIMKAFIESQFGYCPLVWMFCGRQTNARINHIHERALRAVYNDEVSLFDELLGRDKSETIHRRNIKVLAPELFKIKNGLSRCDILVRKYGIFFLVFFTAFSPLGGPLCPHKKKKIKNSRTLREFSIKPKSWIPRNCPCRICENYI